MLCFLYTIQITLYNFSTKFGSTENAGLDNDGPNCKTGRRWTRLPEKLQFTVAELKVYEMPQCDNVVINFPNKLD